MRQTRAQTGRRNPSANSGILYRWLQGAADQATDHAVVYRDTYLSWRGLLHRVDRRATELESMGIERGDWVGLMLGNVPDLLVLSLAASKLGAAIVPLDPTIGSRDLEPILSRAPLRALVTRPRGGESAPTAGPSDRGRNGTSPEARRRLQGTLLSCAVYPRRPTPGCPAAILFTSGSSGEPVAVARTDAILEAITDLAHRELRVTAGDRVLAAVPFFHGYGFDLGFALALRFGTTVVLEDEFSQRRMISALKKHDVSFCPGTPTIYEALAAPSSNRPTAARTARFLSGGSPMSALLAKRFFERFGVRLLSCYHTTEAGPIAIDRRGLNPESVGKPFGGVRMRAGQNRHGPGPLWVQSATVSDVILGQRRESMGEVPIGGVDERGWLRTGDMGRADRSGRWYLEGREDDVVKVDGRRVALGEVEACLESFPKVVAARAEILSDPLAGAVVVAQIVPNCKCAPEEIIDHCARNLASYKVPRRVRFVNELVC